MARVAKVPDPSRQVAMLDTWKLPAGREGEAICALDLIVEASTPPAFAIDRVAKAGDVVLLKGAEKVTLKTSLALQLAIARITGGAWLGFDAAKARPRPHLDVLEESCRSRGEAPTPWRGFVAA